METLRILITDDEPGMRMAVTRALRDFVVRLPEVEGEVGFTVDDASTGEEALKKIDAATPHILLLDYKLPGISGLDVLEQIKTRNMEILTIMITAYASLETAVTATKRGAYDFLPKPFTPDELKHIIRKASGRIILSKQAKRLAEEKRKVRFQFISVLAHELKAPLAAIEGYLQIMKSHTAGDDIASYEQIIDRSAIRLDGMRKLIIDLLDMTRIESGEKQRELSEVDVNAVAESARETVLPSAESRNITIDIHSDASVTMDADRGELEIILNNLISNAVKYNRDNGKVDVTISHDEEKITIVVTDTGIGMTDEEAGKLFNDFVRIKNQKTRNILGSGLGLSIVKKLAQLYYGEVSVSSKPDVGSTFTVILKK
ncbi:MAG: response regulator [Candidatus Latescibacteria bacterium]|nr:response regulator [Candidatus Latescibacterota bacterium]